MKIKKAWFGIIVGIAMIIIGCLRQNNSPNIVSLDDLYFKIVAVLGYITIILNISCGNFKE